MVTIEMDSYLKKWTSAFKSLLCILIKLNGVILFKCYTCAENLLHFFSPRCSKSNFVFEKRSKVKWLSSFVDKHSAKSRWWCPLKVRLVTGNGFNLWVAPQARATSCFLRHKKGIVAKPTKQEVKCRLKKKRRKATEKSDGVKYELIIWNKPMLGTGLHSFYSPFRT